MVGQVMSYNDSNWSVFWSMGDQSKNPVDAANLNVGKHVAEDPNSTRANETIGYIVVEGGAGTIDGVAYEAAMDGNDGSWAVLSGSSPLSPTNIDLYVSEDQLNDSEQRHANEQVGYIVFE